MASNTFTLSAVGSTAPVLITAPTTSIRVPPGIIVNLSAGSVLTYTVQVTGDSLTSSNYNPATGIWNSFDGLAGLTASANGSLSGLVTGLRCTITSYTSGTLTFQVIQ